MAGAALKEDTFHTNGTAVACTFFLTSVETHFNDATVVSIEDWVLRQKLREDIIRDVLNVAERMVAASTLPVHESSQPPNSGHVF